LADFILQVHEIEPNKGLPDRGCHWQYRLRSSVEPSKNFARVT